MRRSLALLFCVAALVSALCLTAYADEMDEAVYYGEDAQDVYLYTDVRPENWFYDDVMALSGASVLAGFPDGSFRPDQTVTTGQALKMILRVVGYDEPAPVASHWARGYMNLALDEGILLRGEITDLDVTISRQLVVTLAARAMGAERTSENYTFSDAPNDDVQALVDCGIIGGYSDGTFRPTKSLTRAEIAAIVHRIQTHRALGAEGDDGGQIETRTTEKGIDFIKAREGFTANAYWDYAQYSIGYGSRCEKNEYPDGITREQADRLLRLKLQQIETTLTAFCEKNDLDLNEAQYDALVSLTYNVGTSWMSGTRLSELIRSGRYDTNAFASAMGIWCHVTEGGKTRIEDGLIVRRALEVKLFLYGDYDGNRSNDFCHLIYESDRGELEVDIALYEAGSTYDPLFSASCAGTRLVGWFTADGTQITDSTTVRESMTVYARWEGDAPEDTGDWGEDVWDEDVWDTEDDLDYWP